MKFSSSLGALIIPLFVFSAVGFLQTQSKPWLNGRTATAKAALLDTEVAIAGVETTVTASGFDLSTVAPEIYWAPIGTTDINLFLAAQGVTVFPEDIIRAFPNPDLQVGGAVKIYRAQAILVDDAGQETLIHTWLPTVGEALAEHSIELGEQDQVEPAVGSAVLTAERLVPVNITITRVQETEVTVKETIAHQTQIKPDSALEKGLKEVDQKGQNGIKALTYLVRRENGVEVSRKLIDTVTEQQPVTEIIREGTKVKIYGTGTATWYTKRLNHVAAHNNLPKGTKVKVVNTVTGKSTVVTVVGGGLYTDAVIDLSYDAFSDIGDPAAGRLSVRIEKVY